MITWFKKLLGIVRRYDADFQGLRTSIAEARQFIQDRTSIHADVSPYRGYNQIIVVGRYKRNDYVEVFDVQDQDFSGLIDMLREMQKYGQVRRVDGPVGPFRTTIESELNR
jgi:hypothetical protein